MAKKKQEEDYGAELQKSYEQWSHYYEHGGSDPFWPDGTNLNLIRNHIMYYRQKLEENPTLMGYPEAYYKDLPPEVDNEYMARADEIRAAAKVSLERYKADPNYQYIVKHREDYTKKTQDKLSIGNVIGYATGLERYIKEDRLVDVRRHERTESYLKAFEECVIRMKNTPVEVNQSSVFSIIDGVPAESVFEPDDDDYDDGVSDDGADGGEYDGEPDQTDFVDDVGAAEPDMTDVTSQDAVANPAPFLDNGLLLETSAKTDKLSISQSEWDAISSDYKGEWTRDIWEFRGGDVPESWIGKRTVVEQALPDSAFERAGRKKDYTHGSTLITEGNGFEIVNYTVKSDNDSIRRNQASDVSPHDNIPDELKNLRQWAVFRTYPDKQTGKLKKVITSPVNSHFAHIDVPETWVTYRQAKAYMEKYRYKGLVFALNNGELTFIDIDHAIEDGEIVSPEAKRLLELFPDTYTEKSVSGTGIHILIKGALPRDAYRRNDEKGIEMYDSRRFICMTGDTLNDSRGIKDYSDRIVNIAYEFAGRRPPKNDYIPIPTTQSDMELINQIFASRQGTKFKSLYLGDTSAYPSHSHAESALVFTLAWWTQNPAQIDSIVRSSGLMRDKWDSPRGNGTYGSQLIAEALSTVTPREQRQRTNQQEYY